MSTTYIAGLKFNEDTYYVRIRDDGWEEVIDPSFASEFANKQGPLIWMKNNTTFEEYAVSLVKEKEVEKYNEWVKGGTVRRKFASLSKNSRAYKGESPEEVLQWWVETSGDSDSEIKYDHYKTWPKPYVLFKHIHERESYYSRDYKEKYLSFSIYCRKTDTDYETFLKEMRLVLPHVTRVENGYKVLSVFDHFLSEGGNSVSLYYKSDDDCYVSDWGRKKRNLKECFEYLVKERYYE